MIQSPRDAVARKRLAMFVFGVRVDWRRGAAACCNSSTRQAENVATSSCRVDFFSIGLSLLRLLLLLDARQFAISSAPSHLSEINTSVVEASLRYAGLTSLPPSSCLQIAQTSASPPPQHEQHITSRHPSTQAKTPGRSTHCVGQTKIAVT